MSGLYTVRTRGSNDNDLSSCPLMEGSHDIGLAGVRSAAVRWSALSTTGLAFSLPPSSSPYDPSPSAELTGPGQAGETFDAEAMF